MKVFENAFIGSLTLKNRFVRSATGERMATPEGFCSPGLVKVVRGLAEGGVGMIIPGHAAVAAEGRSDPGQLGIFDDAGISGLEKLTAAAHENGAAVVLQLTHAGAKADPEIAGIPLKSSTSTVTDRGIPVEAMDEGEIAGWVKKFGDAAQRAQASGFDGVQIHMGHGYGLCQFVSPFLNRRTDRYGGSLENRSRIVLEVLREIRGRVGAAYPVIAKMNSDDFIEGGTSPDMMAELAGMLEREGLDGVEISGGIGHPRARFGGARAIDPVDESQEVYYRDAARLFKQKCGIPSILVGGIRRLATAEKIVGEGLADFVAMSRPFIREPRLIGRWNSGDAERAACISCNGCSKAVPDGKGTRCIFEENLHSEKDIRS